ncbi:MAG TPA: hypothetical protein VGC03_18085 [Acidimicrobiia bacterium]|jgi:hypothetical protein
MKAPGVPALSLGYDAYDALFESSLIGVRGQTVEGLSMPAIRAIDSTNRVYIEPPTRHLTEEK